MAGAGRARSGPFRSSLVSEPTPAPTHLVAATSSGVRVFSCSSLEHVFSRSSFTFPDGSGAAGEVTSADLASSSFLVAIVFGDTIQMMSAPSAMPGTTSSSPARTGRRSMIFPVCALAQVEGGRAFVLACPSPTIGEVHVWHGSNGDRVDVHAHNWSVACLELSGDGQLLATADSTGTVLRIFSTIDGLTLQESYVNEGVRYMAGFGQEPNTILVVGADGSFYRCQFDPLKGHMKPIEHKNFMKMDQKNAGAK
uniref:Anaphase-promoting complex subunit 4 WD40 domain-containing protein n=1 Tax=Setaria viridis TaxID=4556 RepID=A0A4U6W1W0_SETVI|nr:hypothetical protein SEVIR_2G438500v2 [Setaria viridis]